MRRILASLLAPLAVAAAVLVPAAAAQAAPASSASCTRDLPVSSTPNQVQMHAKQTCGFSYRAWADFGGKYRYGTYTKVNGNNSTACDESSCQGHPDGTLFQGGYQVKRTGKMVRTFGTGIHATGLVAVQKRNCAGCWNFQAAYAPNTPWLGFNQDQTGDYLRGEYKANARDFYWDQISGNCTYLPSPPCVAGHFISFLNHRVIAANCGSSGQTLELVANQGTTGDTWEWGKDPVSGGIVFDNRHCNYYMAMQNGIGTYAVVGTGPGLYNAMNTFKDDIKLHNPAQSATAIHTTALVTQQRKRLFKTLCEQFNGHLCLWVRANSTYGNPIDEEPASLAGVWSFDRDGGSYQGWDTGTLTYLPPGQGNQCAGQSFAQMTIKHCSGDTGTEFANDVLANGNHRFVNLQLSKAHGGTPWFIIGNNVQGSNYFVGPASQVTGSDVSQFNWGS